MFRSSSFSVIIYFVIVGSNSILIGVLSSWSRSMSIQVLLKNAGKEPS